MNAENKRLARNLILIVVITLIILFGYNRAERYDEGNREYEEARISTVINNANFCLGEYILNPSMSAMNAVFDYYSMEAVDSIDRKCYYLEETIAYAMDQDALKQQRAKRQKIVFSFENDIRITKQIVINKWFRPDKATVWATELWKYEKTFHKYSLKFFEDGGWKIVSDEWQKAPFASPKPQAKGWMLR